MDYSKKLYEMMELQRELDNYISWIKEIDLHPYDLFTNRCLAFSVELGEFANEVRTFKHWSNKPMSDKSVVIEEYVDALHFLLSISYTICDEAEGMPIDFVFHINKEPQTYETPLEVNVTLLELFNVVSRLYFGWVDHDYAKNMSLVNELWQEFSILGELMGFSDEDIDKAYAEKYRKNIERQKEGY